MYFHVRTFKTSNSEDLSVLLDQNLRPAFWPNVFVTMEYRNAGLSSATALAVLRVLGMVETWGAARNIDVSELLTRGPFLSVEQAEDLALFLRLRRNEQDTRADGIFTPKIRRVVNLESVRPRSTSESSSEQAANPVEAAKRIRWVVKYLRFLLARRLSSGKRRSIEQKEFESNANRAISRLEALTPRANSSAYDESLGGLEAEVVSRLDEVLDPQKDHIDNPFTKGFVRDRNFLIWRFLRDTGMRRSELLWLRVEHVDYATRRVFISKSKTAARTVPISERTVEAFHSFVLQHWSKAPPTSTRHGFLLISEKGGHLTAGSINDILEAIRDRVPGIPSGFSPHVMRRTWNDRFSALVDGQPEEGRMAPEHEKQVRNRLMGWSQNSEMGARYSRRYIRKKADELGEKLANQLHNQAKADE